MTDLDALTAQLRKLGLTPAALHALAVLAKGNAARHVALLTAAYNQAVYDNPAAVLAMCRPEPEPFPPSLPRPPIPACRCGARGRVTRLGSDGQRYCRPCYVTEIDKRRKELSNG